MIIEIHLFFEVENMNRKAIALVLLMAMVPVTATAGGDRHNKEQFVYFGPAELTSVEQLEQNYSFFSKNDVIMEGYIIHQLSDDEFIFTDGEGEVKVELKCHTELDSFDDKSKVRIYGEYKSIGAPVVEIKHMLAL